MFLHNGLVNNSPNDCDHVWSPDENQLWRKTDRVVSECEEFQKESNGSDFY